jgi:hypothetical protein
MSSTLNRVTPYLQGFKSQLLAFRWAKYARPTVCAVLETTDDLVLHCCRKDSLHQLIKVKADNAKG